MNVSDRIPKNQNTNELTVIRQLAQSQVLKPYLTQRIAKDGTVVEVWITSTALVNEAGQMYAIATTERAKVLKINRIMEVHYEKQG